MAYADASRRPPDLPNWHLVHALRTTNVVIVGAGSLGVAWAIVFARSGAAVRVHDPDASRLSAAPEEMLARLGDLESHRLLEEHPQAILSRITLHEALAQAAEGADYVQECAPEQLELKRSLFSQLERMVPSEAILASSSSALTPSEIADGLPGRARCLVAHPANPPYLLPVVELIAAPFTDPRVVDRAETLLRAAGMSPVRVGLELEGFVMNRLQGALLREAYCLVRDGVATVEDVDRVVRDGLGRRWALIGPFETADLNTRGGIAAHAERMGAAYARMGAERGQHDPWTPELVARVSAERRALLPLERWSERVSWRDRALMTLECARRSIETDGQPR
jgi:L-gulonate 3-dehydrogenase